MLPNHFEKQTLCKYIILMQYQGKEIIINSTNQLYKVRDNKDYRCVQLQQIENMLDGKYVTYECITPKIKVLVRTIDLKQIEIGEIMNISCLMQEEEQPKMEIIIKKYENKYVEIRTIAFMKILNQLQLGQHMPKDLCRVDAVIFKDRILYFKQYSIKLLQYAKDQKVKITTKDMGKNLEAQLKQLQQYHIILYNINQQSIYYSPKFNKLVFKAFGYTRAIMQKGEERTKVDEFLPNNKYYSPQLKNIKDQMQRYSQRNRVNKKKEQSIFEVKFYEHDTQCLKHTLNQLNKIQCRSQFSPINRPNKKYPHELPFILKSCFLYSVGMTEDYQNVISFANTLKFNDEEKITVFKEIQKIFKCRGLNDDRYQILKQIQIKNNADKINMIEVLIQMKKLSDAEKILSSINEPLLIKCELEAKILFEYQQYEKCKAKLDSLFRKLKILNQPEQSLISPLMLLGLSNIQSNKFNQGIEAFKKIDKIIKQKITSSSTNQEQEKSIRNFEKFNCVNMGNLASVYLDTGEYDQSEKIFLELSQNHEKYYGYRHPILFTAYYGLAKIYFIQGLYKKFKEQMIKCNTLLKKNQLIGNQIYDKVNELVYLIYEIEHPFQSKIFPETLMNVRPFRETDKNKINKMILLEYKKRQIMFNHNKIHNNQTCLAALDKLNNDQAFVFKSYNIQILLLNILIAYIKSISPEKKDLQKLIEICCNQIKQRNIFPYLLGILNYLKGKHYAEKQNIREALKCFQQSKVILQKVIQDSFQKTVKSIFAYILEDLRNRLTMLYLNNRSHDKIRQMYKLSIQKNRATPEMYKTLAEISNEEKKYQEAIQLYKQFFKQNEKSGNSENIQAYQSLAEIYRQVRDVESALQYYLKIEKCMKDEIYIKIGELYESKKQIRKALQYYLKVKNLNENALLCKRIAKICVSTEGESGNIKKYLTIYMKYLERNKSVDSEIYQIMLHIPELDSHKRILALNQQLKILRNHPQQVTQAAILKAKTQLAKQLYLKKDYVRAGELYDQICLNQDLKSNEEVVKNRFQCAIHKHSEKIENETIYLDTILMYQKMKGEYHVETLKLIRHLGIYFFEKGRYYQAFIYLIRFRFAVGAEQQIISKINLSFQKLMASQVRDMSNPQILKLHWAYAHRTRLVNLLDLSDSIKKCDNRTKKMSLIYKFMLEYLIIDANENTILSQYSMEFKILQQQENSKLFF